MCTQSPFPPRNAPVQLQDGNSRVLGVLPLQGHRKTLEGPWSRARTAQIPQVPLLSLLWDCHKAEQLELGQSHPTGHSQGTGRTALLAPGSAAALISPYLQQNPMDRAQEGWMVSRDHLPQNGE